MDRVRSASLESSEMKAFRLWMAPLPAALRPHWMAVAAMIRLADLEADTGDHETRLRRFDAWFEKVLAAIRAGGSDDPLLHATAHTFDVWKLRTSYLEETFGAARRDTMFTPFATYEELERWAQASTGCLLLLHWGIGTPPGTLEEAEPHLRVAGAGFQIADTLYDLAEDLQDGRLYLPLEDLERFGVTQDDLFQGRDTPAVNELLAFAVDRTRGLDRRMDELRRCSDPAIHMVLQAVARYLEMCLDAVRADGAKVLRRPPPMRLYRNLTELVPALLLGSPPRPDAPPARASAARGGVAGQLDARSERVAIEAEVRRQLASDHSLLELLCSRGLLPLGDALRPVLCLSSVLATGGSIAEVLPIAAGLECLHAACEIHGDLLERSATRAGPPAPPPRQELEDSLLVGDGLLIHGFLALVDTWEGGVPAERALPVLRIVSRTLETSSRASLLESRLRGDLSAGIEQCLEVIRGKTAAHTRAACEIGGIVAGAPPAQVEALGRYGEALGMAIQIRDDLRPYTEDPRILDAAAISGGVRNRHPTLPVLLARDLAADADRGRLEALLAGAARSLAAHRALRELVIRTGGAEEAARRARVYAALAREALTELPPSAARDRLADLATTGGLGAC
jgi:geranylgeranyl diphosphate synthase type I